MTAIQPEPAQTATPGPDRRKRRLSTAIAILAVVVVVAGTLDMKADNLTVANTGINVQLSGGQTTLHGSGDSC